MIRRLSLTLCAMAVVAATLPGAARADGSDWNVSTSSDLVTANLISSSADSAQLSLENHVSLEPFDMPAAGAILDALGFGGGYSQEVSWSNAGTGPIVSCPKGLIDLLSFCHANSSTGWALIPDGLPTTLELSGPAGNANLLVKPSIHSVEYDSALAAIGLALSVISTNPKGVVIENARLVASLAAKLSNEASGYAAAAARKDYTAAAFELLSLSKRAAAAIADSVTQWAIGAIADLSPFALEVKLLLAISQIDTTLVNLDARLLIGDASSVVTVTSSGGQGGAQGPTPTPAPTPAMDQWTWSTVATAPAQRDRPNGDSIWEGAGQAVPLANGRVLIAGTPNLIYDPASSSWKQTTAFPSANVFSLGGDKVLALTAPKGGAASGWVYDAGTDTAKSIPAPPSSVASSAYVRLPDGRLLFLGGDDGNGNMTSDVLAFDQASDQWAVAGHLKTAVTRGTAAVLSDGRVIVFGELETWADGSAAPQLFDPRTGTSTEVALPPGYMGQPPGYLFAYKAQTLTDGRVEVLYRDPPVDAVAFYDPASGGWTKSIGAMEGGCSARALLSNGDLIYVGGGGEPTAAGGCNALGPGESAPPPTGDVTYMDPRVGSDYQSSPLASLVQPCVNPGVIELPDGRVLIEGADWELLGPGGLVPTPAATPTPTPTPTSTSAALVAPSSPKGAQASRGAAADCPIAQPYYTCVQFSFRWTSSGPNASYRIYEIEEGILTEGPPPGPALILTLRPGTTSAEWVGDDVRCYGFTIVAFNSVGASAPIDFAGDVCPA